MKKNQNVKRITPTLISPMTTTTNKTFDPSKQPVKKRISTTLLDVSTLKLPTTEFGEEQDDTVEKVDLTASNDESKSTVQNVNENNASKVSEEKKIEKNEENNNTETATKRKDTDPPQNDNSSSKQRKVNQNSITSYFAQH